MKTRKTILTIALLLLAAFAAFAQQYNPESDFEVEVIDNGRAVRITGYNGNNTVVNIPPRIGNLPVTEIGDFAFAYIGITSLTIPNGINYIGDGAFNGNQLAIVTVPNSVTYIGSFAFAENNLRAITISNNVTSIGMYAFDDNQLTNVNIPNSVTSIGMYAFSGNSLTSVTIGNRVETIGSGAFANNQLTTVTIPNSVTTIGGGAFSGNTLTSVSIPANVTIARDAFDGGIAELYSQRGRRAFHFEQGLVFNVTLPAGNPRQADLLLGAAVFQELQVLRFLGDTAAVNRHEEVLRFITGRGNATRTEVETFYRNGIRGLVSDAVDAEFGVSNNLTNSIKDKFTSFFINPNATTYAAILTESVSLSLLLTAAFSTGNNLESAMANSNRFTAITINLFGSDFARKVIDDTNRALR